MKTNNTVQVKTKNGTLQVKRLPEGFQIIAASNDLQVIHSMNLTDEAMMSLNFCVGYLVASEGLAKSEQEVAQVASKPKTKFKVGDSVKPIKGICGSLGGSGPYKIVSIEGDRLGVQTPHGVAWEWESKVEKIPVRKKPTKPEKVTVEFFNIRWKESDNRTGELPYRLVATLKDDQSKAERDLLFAKKFKCLPIGYEFRIIEGGKK